MAIQDLGAPGTLHSKLRSMREKGWITLADTEDTRRKQVELTETALQFLDEVGARIVEAAQRN
jgi:DNA-binding MarR family transcriptional regulator